MRHHNSTGWQRSVFRRRGHKAAAISTKPVTEPDEAEEVVMSDLVESEFKLATLRLEKSQ
jgi:hypothetical protein